MLVSDNFEFPDLLGAAYKYLIKFFADSAGKKGVLPGNRQEGRPHVRAAYNRNRQPQARRPHGHHHAAQRAVSRPTCAAPRGSSASTGSSPASVGACSSRSLPGCVARSPKRWPGRNPCCDSTASRRVMSPPWSVSTSCGMNPQRGRILSSLGRRGGRQAGGSRGRTGGDHDPPAEKCNHVRVKTDGLVSQTHKR